MDKRLSCILTFAALALIGVTMACADDNAPNSLPAAPAAAAQRPTIGPNKTPPGPTVHEVAQTTTLSGSDPGPVSASCPQDEVALGGGWSVPSQNARVFSAVLTGNTWAVHVAHPGPTNSGALVQTGTPGTEVGITVTAFVECLHGAAGAMVTQRSTTWDLPPTPATESNDHLGGHVALCNQGETLVGFGFVFGSASANLELEGVWARTDVPPVAEPLMVFTVRNHDSVTHAIPLFVECLSNVSVSASYPHQSGGSEFAGAIGSAVMSCPAGTTVAGGGLSYGRHDSGNQILGNLFHLQAATGGWQGEVFTVSGFGLIPLTFTVAAICLSFSA